MLAVEALSRIHWPTGLGWGIARYGGAGIVALGSAVISYGHLRDVVAGTTTHWRSPSDPWCWMGSWWCAAFALLANSLTSTGDTPGGR